MSESLIAFHRELADAALLERLASGALTDEARRIALDECARRRLSIPTPDLPPTSVTKPTQKTSGLVQSGADWRAATGWAGATMATSNRIAKATYSFFICHLLLVFNFLVA